MTTIEQVKSSARGHWLTILTEAGIPADSLTGRNGPCPKCGGNDRFAAFTDVADTGGVNCRKCHNKRNHDGIATVQWYRGCTFREAINFVQKFVTKPTRAFQAGREGNGSPSIEAEYNYCNEAGELLWQVVRHKPKDFKQRRPDGKGGWTWSVKGVRVVPYRLPELLAADPEATVFVVEGEKDCDNLARIGVLATCNAGGAGKWTAEHSEFLRGRRVIVLPDNDEAGRNHAQQVAQSLHGLAESVRIVELPGLPDKGDVSDWIAAGGTNEELQRLAEAAPVWTPAATERWPEPRPLPGLATVQPFSLDLLPDSFRGWVADISDRMQCPADFPAVGAMVAAASIVGRKIGIRPKRQDDWLVVPNLWGAAVARPSLLKTPSIQQTMNMIYRLERDEKKKYGELLSEHTAGVLVRDAKSKSQKADLARTLKDHGEEAAMAQARGFAEAEGAPVRRRYFTNDSSVEKLGEILNQNPVGVLVYRDELIGLMRSLEKEGQEGARAFYLEAWNGDGRFTYDRIQRGTLEIDACCISVLGCIQPGPLCQFMRDAVRGGRGDDGLLQRFQLLVWPDIPTEWRNVDRWPDTPAKTKAWDVYQRLNVIGPDGAGAMIPDDGGIPFLRFSDEAQEEFDRWRERLELRLRSDDESDAFVAHLAKYRSLVPSLALLFHLIDDGRGPVGDTATRRAIRWVEYLESHARRLYGALYDPQHGPARALADRILKGGVESGFTLRDIYQHHWTNLDGKEEVGEGVDVLVGLGWLRSEEMSTGGRPTTTFTINPGILNRARVGGCKSTKSPAGEPFAPFAPSPVGHRGEKEALAESRDVNADGWGKA